LTRTNKPMIFARLEDDSGNVEVLIFPKLLATTADIWQEGKAVICQGKISDKDQDIKVLANTAMALDLNNIKETTTKLNHAGTAENGVLDSNAVNKDLKIIFLSSLDNENLELLKALLVKYRGLNRVFFEIGANGGKKLIKTDYRISNSAILHTEIKNKLGNTVKLVQIDQAG
ncbi:DNA polymerase III subunit alpha, partial [bacterium]|nr:DNA polymerase III subunit alpha [bacterium]